MDTFSMKNKTDKELLQIVEHEANLYLRETIEEAKAELNRRGISFKEGTDSRVSYPVHYAEKYYETYNRLLEYLLDSAVISLLTYAVSLIPGLPGKSLFIYGTSLIGFLVFILYYFLLEGFFGKTVGKMVLRLRVVDIDGNAPTWGAIAIRTLCRLIPFEQFSFFFGKGWRKDHTLHGFWHDKLSKTYVVFN